VGRKGSSPFEPFFVGKNGLSSFVAGASVLGVGFGGVSVVVFGVLVEESELASV
jgi:hypothetical protein